MKRDYDSGVADDVTFFIGKEIERTAAYGLQTLFVTGIQSIETIWEIYVNKGCEHIYLGANQSFEATEEWNDFCIQVLACGVLTTVDFDVKHSEWILETAIPEFENVICQISVKIPYLAQFGYNTTLKIDDKDFKASNAGVWCHDLNSLLDRDRFTGWSEYKDDTIIS